MKKTILIVYICLFPYLLLGNELIIGEYYLDFDPGIGFANEFTFVSNEVINLIDSINYSNLSDGFHSFNFRIKDENGLWSFTQSIQFYVFKDKFVITTPPIEQIEYFIDKDLGIGNNHKINMIKENDINILDSLENVLIEPGFHTFNMRLIDTSGKSGYNQSFPFYVFKKREEPVICPIEQIEYFIDKDLGIGNNPRINMIKKNDINILDSLENVLIEPGFHTFNMRLIDTSGKSGYNQSFPFHVFKKREEPVICPIEQIEYFIDKDLGIGNHTKLNITKSESINLLDSIAELNITQSFHILNIRIIDSSGLSGLSKSIPFYIFPGKQVEKLSPIASIEYFFGKNDPGIELGQKHDVKDSIKINNTVWNPVTNLTKGPEKVSVRFVDSLGITSHLVTKDITICEIDGPLAGFETYITNNRLTLFDTSYNASKWIWDFGDSCKDSIRNPTHLYNVPGKYYLKSIVNNQCGTDTLIVPIGIFGITSIEPLEIGKSSNSTIIAHGGNFDSTLTGYLYIIKEDTLKIYPDSIIISDDKFEAYFIFDLSDATVGFYNFAYKNYSMDNFEEMKDKIKIGNPIKSYVLMDLNIPEFARAGREATGSLFFTNYGNTDDNAWRIYNIICIGDTSFTINFKDFGIIDTLNVGEGSLTIKKTDKLQSDFETINKEIIWPNDPDFKEMNLKEPWTIIPVCRKGPISGEEIPFKFIYNNLNHSAGYDKKIFTMEITAFNNPDTEKNVKVSNTKSNPNKIYKMDYKNSDAYMNIFKDCMSNTLEGCIKQKLGPEGGFKIKTNSAVLGVRGKINKKFDKLLGEEPDDIDFICEIPKYKNQKVGRSKDPNKKEGPFSNDTIHNYYQSWKVFNYKIYFENLDSATAYVQELIVTDTLNKDYFDLNTFRFGNFELSDSTFEIPPFSSEFTTDIDIPNNDTLKIRLNAKLDTLTGIIKWHFIGIDPTTGSLTEDPVAGFLAPNVNPPEGEGFVSYKIELKDSIINGTEIKNKASIIFDVNEPILTNEWLVTIDNDKPSSQLNEIEEYSFDSTITLISTNFDPTGEVEYIDVYVAVNNNDFYLYDRFNAQDTIKITGQYDSIYKFYSIAVDYAGNVEEAKEIYDTYTTIKQLKPPVLTAPADSTVFVDVIPVFELNSAEYAVQYQLQLSSTEDFSNIILDVDNLFLLSYQFADTLEYSTDYFWRMRTINGTSHSDWSAAFTFKTIDEPVLVPENWKFADNTGFSVRIIIPQNIYPKVGGRNIATGDAVGLFFTRNDSLICAGFGVWSSTDMNITVWGDNPATPFKEGFAQNEIFTFRVWDAQAEKVKKGFVEYKSGSNKFMNGATSELSKLVTSETQQIVLSMGWNLNSTYIIPDYQICQYLIRAI